MMKIESMKTKEDLIKAMEKRFDQVFGTTLWQEHKETKPYPGEASQYVSCGETVKEFIRSELSLYQNHIRETVEKMKKEWIPESGKIEDHWGLTETGISRTIENNKTLGYNQALDDVKEIIK